MNTDLEKREPGQLRTVERTPENTTAALIEIALRQNQNPTELYAILREERAREAKGQYDQALAAFRAACPPVPKRTAHGQFSVTVDGVKRPRMYADLDTIQATIDPHLSKHGLSYRWGDCNIGQGQADGKPLTLMTIACVLSHVGGHSETATATVPTESAAGASPAQKWMSAGTYCRRYSLIAVTGIKGCDADDDGQDAGGDEEPGEKITEQEARELADAIISAGGDKARFCKMFGVIGLSDLPKSKLESAWQAVEAKRKAAK